MTTRPDVGKVWASAASTSNVQNPDQYQPGKVNLGWVSEIPPFQWFNWILKRNDELKRSLVERGIAAWGSDVTYLVGALAYNDVDFTIYICLKSNKGIQPNLDDGTNWVASAVQISLEDFTRLTGILDEHVKNMNNPHNLTAAQIKAYTSAQIDELLAKASGSLSAHEQDFNNPHNTTATQAGAVPITGGKYTGVVEFTQTSMDIGNGSGIKTDGDYTRLYKGDFGLGISAANKPVFSTGATQQELLYTENFTDITVENNPSFTVSTPNIYLPLNGDICIYEGADHTGFTRPSRGSYINLQGVPAIAEVDQPRFERGGLLMENNYSNLAKYSDLTKDLLTCGAGADALVADTPYGVLSMVQVNASNTWVRLQKESVALPYIQGKTICGSCFIRKRSDATSMLIYLSEATGYVTVYFDETKNKGNAHVKHIVGNYYRIWLTHTFPSSETRAVDMHIQMGGNGDAVGGIQIEEALAPTSWIPTAGAITTRAADSFFIAPSFGTAGAMTFAWEFDTYYPIRAVNQTLFADHNTGLTSWLYDLDGYQLQNRTTSGSMISAKVSSNKSYRVVFSYANDGASIWVNGVLVANNTTVGWLGDKFNEFQKTFIGCAPSGGQTVLGHIRNLRVWNQRLTPQQISTL